MEAQISLYHGLTFLAWVTGVFVVVLLGFLVKLLINLSKLTKNLDETTSMVKDELEPTLKEVNKTIKTINVLVENADKNIDVVKKSFDSMFSVGSLALLRVKSLSGGLIKSFAKGFFTVLKLFLK